MKIVQPLRLLLLTPLILTELTIAQQAAWFLFATISIFGHTINEKVNEVFTNMVAMAKAGAHDLSPISNDKSKNNSSNPNWPLIFRVYNCLTVIKLYSVVIIFLLNTIIGYYTLKNIVADIPIAEERSIWIGFMVMRAGDFILALSTSASVALRGLNHVALIHRWGILFQLSSVLAGSICLLYGGGIVELALVMQVVVALATVVYFWLTRKVNDGLLWSNFKLKWDHQVYKWASKPLWKGLILNLSRMGAFQLSSLILTFYSSNKFIASYLLTLTIIRAIQNFSISPFTSKMPLFSSLLSSQQLSTLRRLLTRSVLLSLAVYLISSAILIVVGNQLIYFLKSENAILPATQTFLLASLILYRVLNYFAITICAAGNHIKYYWSEALSSIISCGLMFILIPKYGVNGIIFSLFIPACIILNFRPFRNLFIQLKFNERNKERLGTAN